MSFRSSNVLPAKAYDTVRGAAVQLKLNLQGFNTRLANSGADYDFVREIYRTLGRANDQFSALKTTPGLAQYARDAEVDQTYDVAGAFTSMQAAIAAASDWIVNNVPASVTVKPPAQWDSSTLISDTFTPAQTGGLQAKLSAVIAEIS